MFLKSDKCPEDADLVILGAGITGAAIFHLAAKLGLKTLLLDKGEPGAKTTAASSGLLHGGLRYLSYDVETSALSGREAGLLSGIYPDLTRRQIFLWPVYRGDPHSLDTVEALLEYYDRFVDSRRAKRHVRLSARETLALENRLNPQGLVGAVSFDEWAVDAQGLAARLVEEGRKLSGRFISPAAVREFKILDGCIAEVVCQNAPGNSMSVSGKVVVNAAGPWSEEISRLAGSRMVKLFLRKGAHLIVEGLTAPYGLIFPDFRGRYLGLYPRGGEAWVGPTDTPFHGNPEDVGESREEAELLLRSLGRVLPEFSSAALRTVAGVRPIVKQSLPGPLSRDWRVYDHGEEGLRNFITATGGKLTLHQVMAQETCGLVLRKLEKTSAVVLPSPVRRRPVLSFLFSIGFLSFFWIRHQAMKVFGAAARSGLDLFQQTYR